MSFFILNGTRGTAGASGVILPTFSSLWLFNESGGTTVADEEGVSGLTQAGGTLASGKLTIDGGVASRIWNETAANYDTNLGDFTVFLWIMPAAADLSRHILLLGANSNLENSMSFKLSTGTPSALVRASVNNGSATSSVSTTGALTTALTFIALRYTRTGGAADNILKVDMTTDGVTWDRNSISNANLMQRVSGYLIRSKGSSGGTAGISAEYNKVGLINGSSITDNELQDIYDAGSE